jgi:hypothetical protein
MKNFLFGAAVTLVMTAGAQANTNSNGHELFENLRRPYVSNFYEIGVAHGMIAGVAFGGNLVCVPKEKTMQDVINSVKNHLEVNPQVRQFRSIDIIVLSLVLAYPCKR